MTPNTVMPLTTHSYGVSIKSPVSQDIHTRFHKSVKTITFDNKAYDTLFYGNNRFYCKGSTMKGKSSRHYFVIRKVWNQPQCDWKTRFVVFICPFSRRKLRIWLLLTVMMMMMMMICFLFMSLNSICINCWRWKTCKTQVYLNCYMEDEAITFNWFYRRGESSVVRRWNVQTKRSLCRCPDDLKSGRAESQYEYLWYTIPVALNVMYIFFESMTGFL